MVASVSVPASETGPVAPEAASAAPAASATPSTPSTENTSTERPSWLPEKFQTPEALAEAYKALESKLGQQQKQNKLEVPPTTDQTPPANTVTEQQLGAMMQAKGLDFQSFYNEYLQSGQLSDASYQKLEQGGFSRQFINDYIAGQEALAEGYKAQIFGVAGGEQQFQAMANWARAALPPKEIEAFNNVIETGSMEAVMLAVHGLHAKYVAANGVEPRLVGGDPGQSVTGFRSHHEMVKAMSDPRYKKDPAYRADVEKRVATSTFF